MNSYSFFDHDFAFDESRKTASRQALAAALARSKKQFGAFLANNPAERFSLVEDELRQVVADTVSEYGGDDDAIYQSVVVTLAAGAFCDNCHKWKSGSNAACTCSNDDTNASESDKKESSRVVGFATELDKYINSKSLNHMRQWAGVDPNLPSHEVLTQVNRNYPSGVHGYLADNGFIPNEQKQARWSLATGVKPQNSEGMGAWKRENLDGSKETDSIGGNGEPEPKMDKTRWKPNALNEKGNLEPIDTDMDGTRHPTTHQDVSEGPDYTKPLSEKTEGGETHEKLKGTDSFDGAGFNDLRNITQYPTRTFGDKGEQDTAVTKEPFPKKNGSDKYAAPNDYWFDDRSGRPQIPKPSNHEYPENGINVQRSQQEQMENDPYFQDLLNMYRGDYDQARNAYEEWQEGYGDPYEPRDDQEIPEQDSYNYASAKVAFGWDEHSGSCPGCGANPNSETRCSVCKGWNSSREASIKYQMPFPPRIY